MKVAAIFRMSRRVSRTSIVKVHCIRAAEIVRTAAIAVEIGAGAEDVQEAADVDAVVAVAAAVVADGMAVVATAEVGTRA